MKNTIRKELEDYIKVGIDEMSRYKELPIDLSDLHHELFNQDYYIIGYYQADQWLLSHRLNAFEAIGIVQEYENENFGECRMYDNSESVVNMLAYIYGEELLSEIQEEIIS
tara:strand:- start:866 stop:1198 length:333 start_codon:yes stop_codon:yes gene_type:complete